MKVAEFLWERGATPMQIVRGLGPRGEGLLGATLGRRFKHRWSGEEADLISTCVPCSRCLWRVCVVCVSARYCLAFCLIPHRVH